MIDFNRGRGEVGVRVIGRVVHAQSPILLQSSVFESNIMNELCLAAGVPSEAPLTKLTRPFVELSFMKFDCISDGAPILKTWLRHYQ